jgi:catechol 2,3-dioxygenase-like lactoylglutathione lyase family enzyme
VKEGRLSIQGLDHVNIATPRLEETRAFYCAVLGLKEGYRPAFKVPGYWLYLGDRPLVHLQYGDDAGAGGAIRHFALAVSNLESFLAQLKANGVPYRRAETPDGLAQQVFLDDPGGACIELICAARSEL